MHTLTANNPEREDLVAAPRSGLLLPALAILAVLFLVRLPTFIHARELNMDESQMLSQAMKFLLDAVPWRSVDGTSSGPLNSFFLSGFLWLGIPPGYVFLHVLATAMASLLVVTAFLSIRTLATRRAAAWGVAPMTLCVGFSGNPAFLHYSSELLPALLLALACYFLLRWFVGAQKYPEKSRSICLFFIGASLGSAPWCKLQSAPLSLTLAVAATIAIFVYRKNSLRWAELLFLCIGLALPSILMVMVVLRAGVWNDFWTSYVLANLAYAGPFTWARFSRHILLTLRSIEILPLTSVCAFALLLAGYFAYRKPRRVRPGQHQAVIVFFALFSAVSLASVARPAYFFPHYILFLLFPLSCLAAILISWEFPHLGENLRSLLSTAAKLALAAIVFLFHFLWCSPRWIQPHSSRIPMSKLPRPFLASKLPHMPAEWLSGGGCRECTWTQASRRRHAMQSVTSSSARVRCRAISGPAFSRTCAIRRPTCLLTPWLPGHSSGNGIRSRTASNPTQT